MIIERGETAIFRYDPEENILSISFPPMSLDTPQEIVAHFDRCVSFWKRNCRGRKVYWVSDLDGFDINVKHTAVYAEQLRRVLDFTITIVRYGGTSLQRTATRLANLKLHTSSSIYSSREEAMAVIRALKAGEMTMGAQR